MVSNAQCCRVRCGPSRWQASKDEGADAEDAKPATKKPASAYLLWVADNKEAMKEESPDFTAAQLTKALTDKWATLDQHDKSVWLTRPPRCRRRRRRRPPSPR